MERKPGVTQAVQQQHHLQEQLWGMLVQAAVCSTVSTAPSTLAQETPATMSMRTTAARQPATTTSSSSDAIIRRPVRAASRMVLLQRPLAGTSAAAASQVMLLHAIKPATSWVWARQQLQTRTCLVATLGGLGRQAV